MTRRDPSAEEFAAWRLEHPPIMGGADDGASTSDSGAGDGTAAAGDGGDGGNAGDAGKRFTQDEVNAIMARQKAQYRAQLDGLDDLKARAARADELEEQTKTEAQKVADRLAKAETNMTAAEQRAAAAEARLVRFEVAAEKGLDAKWAARLTGQTREELAADADALLAEITPAPATPRTGFDGGVRGERDQGAPKDMNALIRSAAGRST